VNRPSPISRQAFLRCARHLLGQDLPSPGAYTLIGGGGLDIGIEHGIALDVSSIITLQHVALAHLNQDDFRFL
jgi:hypothetical protein